MNLRPAFRTPPAHLDAAGVNHADRLKTIIRDISKLMELGYVPTTHWLWPADYNAAEKAITAAGITVSGGITFRGIPVKPCNH